MTGVILINFGGPRTSEEIEPFLRDIFKDVLPAALKPFAGLFARLRLARAKRMYDAIGGTSPVVEWTMRQAQALEHRLCHCEPPTTSGGGCGNPVNTRDCFVVPPYGGTPRNDKPFKTYTGMKYGEPSIDDALARAKMDGCKNIILLPLFPYRSKYTDLSLRLSAGLLAEAPYSGARQSPGKQLNSGDCFAVPTSVGAPRNDKLYIRCMTDIIKASLSDWRDIPPPQVTLLFTAHSIPTLLAKNDPYVRQINESVSEIMRRFTGYNFQIAYQSAPFKFGWLGPDVKSAIRQLDMSSPRTRESRLNTRDSRFRGNDKLNSLIIPLGFACENLETLYELDQIYLPYAKKLGMNVGRAPALNDNPIFIDLLAELVLSNRSNSL